MAKPYIHADSCVKKWGGVREDYLEIHDFLDSSKSVFSDNRHRALTHNGWFIFVVERVFGHNITNADGREVSVRDICERHILEDFGNKYIPTAADYLEHMSYEDWMQNGIKGAPSSYRRLAEKAGKLVKKTVMTFDGPGTGRRKLPEGYLD